MLIARKREDICRDSLENLPLKYEFEKGLYRGC
ncbi:hypothetical protein HRED_03559 [Candidatus Haloredivivus sp. G17]|nr:hypothetical protein HRED_03559 [Candidatus Haloredivivus sp. G17]